MPPPEAFADYPDPRQGPAVVAFEAPPRNPALRGYPLLVAGALSPFLQRYLWRNAGFGTIKDLPVLDDVPYTFHPCVTPLGQTGPMLESEPDHLSSRIPANGFRYYSASDYHRSYSSGSVTPLQVADALLSLIRPGPGQPAGYEDAWADSHGRHQLALDAARASTERYAAGQPLGLLDGVPIGVKDDVEVRGYVNHWGLRYDASLSCFKEQPESAWPVKTLQEAGAVVIGKNRMHEMGSDTSGLNVAQGTPTNRLNEAYYPGGSSSGAASALAAGLVPICVGTDAGGSVRIPASWNGLYGLKTSHHRTGFMNSTICITGPLAANVADLRLAYRLMAQPNPECSIQRRFGQSMPPPASAKPVLGFFKQWWEQADPAVYEACKQALDWFTSSRGYDLVEISIPLLGEAQLAHALIGLTELAESARRRTLNPADWLTPCGPAAKVLLSVASQTGAADWLKANAMRTLVMRHLASLFQKHAGLLILTPTTPFAGWPKRPGDETYGLSDGDMTLRSILYVFLANLTGTPSLSAPVAYVEPEQGDGKLAVSLLATGEWGSEEQLLAWAADAEEYLHCVYQGGRRKPPSWVDVMDLAAKQ